MRSKRATPEDRPVRPEHLVRAESLAGFGGITLSELDARAEMLERVDNKYVVKGEVVYEALSLLQSHFDVLDIAGKRTFFYDTCYFDDEALYSFYSHRQGRRRRFKVRTRKYVDSDTCYVEMKVRGRRGVTVKHRLLYSPEKLNVLDQQALEFVGNVYRQFYRRPFEFNINPVLQVKFQRATFVSKEGSERVTIDGDISFLRAAGSHAARSSAFIVESKSTRGNGAADKVMRRLHQRRVSACSKYCFGIAAMHEVRSYNKFLQGMRKLEIERIVLRRPDGVTGVP